MKRRIMAWVLCLMMILTMLPTPTYAAEIPGTAEQTEVGTEAPTSEEHTSQPMKIEAKASGAEVQKAPPEGGGDQSEGEESEGKGETTGHTATGQSYAASGATLAGASGDDAAGEGPSDGTLPQTDPSPEGEPGGDESADGDGSVSEEIVEGGEPTSVPTEVVDDESTEEPGVESTGEPVIKEEDEEGANRVEGDAIDEPQLIAEVSEDEPAEELRVKLSRHEDDKGYTYAGEDEEIIFKLEIDGGAVGEYKVKYLVQCADETVFNSEEPEEDKPAVKAIKIKEETSTTSLRGEFSYPATQPGVYRVTVIVTDEAGAEAKDQLSFAVISKDPVYVCGMEEHDHTDACYAMAEVADNSPYGGMGIEEVGADGEVTLKDAQLICEYAYEHKHDASCLPSCGKIAHKHVDECYNDDKQLICGLEPHVHGEDCRSAEVVEADAADLMSDPGEAADHTPVTVYECGKVAHTHSEECYDEEGNLICGLEPHEHSDECGRKFELVNGSAALNDESSGGEISVEFSGLLDPSGKAVEDDATVYVGQKYTATLNVNDTPVLGDDNKLHSSLEKDKLYTYKLPDFIDMTGFGSDIKKEEKDGLTYYWRVIDGEIQFWIPGVENPDELENAYVDFKLEFKFKKGSESADLGKLHVTVSDEMDIPLNAFKNHPDDEVLADNNTRGNFEGLFRTYLEKRDASDSITPPKDYFADKGTVEDTSQDNLIYWHVDITGGRSDQLSNIRDEIFTGDKHPDPTNTSYPFRGHTFTGADQARGVLVRGTEADGKTIHYWFLDVTYEGNLLWTGGDLTKKITCLDCNQTLEPNNSWHFELFYTSTVTKKETEYGVTFYGNTCTVGEPGKADTDVNFDATRRHWGNVYGADILKKLQEAQQKKRDPDNTYDLIPPGENDSYHFDVTIELPPYTPGDGAPVYGWTFLDRMNLWGEHLPNIEGTGLERQIQGWGLLAAEHLETILADTTRTITTRGWTGTT